MKKIILALIGLGLCLQARSDSLSTTDGTTYNNVTSQRVDPDGLCIEYTPPGGGLGIAKVKFTRLSADQQKQFGYDANKAKEFEAGVAKATEDFRQDSIHREQAAQAQRAADQTREVQQEQALTERIMAMAQLKQAEAELARAMGQGGENAGNGGYGWYSGAGGYGLIALPELGLGSGFGDGSRFGSDFGFGPGFGFGSSFDVGRIGQGDYRFGPDFRRPSFFRLRNPASLSATYHLAHRPGL